MSIKIKILIPMVLLTILVAAAILVSTIIQFSGNVDANLYSSLNTASNVVVDMIESLKSESRTASFDIAGDSEIVKAIENGDRNALLNRATQLQSETGVEFCTVTDANGTVLARSHEPENFGDSVASQANIQAALSGGSLTTIEQGSAVRLSVRSGSPVYNSQGVLLGVASCGYRLDTETFVDSAKSLLGCEVTIFLEDERISTTVIKDDGTRAVGTKAAENVSQTVLAGNAYSGAAKILGRDALTKYTPIINSGGNVLGMLFVGRYQNEKADIIWSFVWVGLLITLALLAVSIPIILLIVSRITVPIKVMVQAAHSLAAGDTGINAQVDTRDEMRQLADAFNIMIDNTKKQVKTIEAIASGDLTVSVEARSDKDTMNRALASMLNRNNDVFSQIANSAKQVSSGSRQVADSSQVLAQGATEQAATVEELCASIGEVSLKTGQNAEMAREAAGLSDIIKRNAEKGSAQMDQMMQAVKEINEASSSISKVIKAIDDIAFQTNILALNAAVEAARAGLHGKGFAVVADEVRNLAAKSAEAAKDTGALIANSIEKANIGYNIAGETAASLKEIVDGINRSVEIVNKISQSSQEQTSTITIINTGIDQVAQVVQQNSATAEQSAAASQQMSSQSSLLEELIAQFKLKDSDGDRFLNSGAAKKTSAAPGTTAFAISGSGKSGKY